MPQPMVRNNKNLPDPHTPQPQKQPMEMSRMRNVRWVVVDVQREEEEEGEEEGVEGVEEGGF